LALIFSDFISVIEGGRLSIFLIEQPVIIIRRGWKTRCVAVELVDWSMCPTAASTGSTDQPANLLLVCLRIKRRYIFSVFLLYLEQVYHGDNRQMACTSMIWVQFLVRVVEQSRH